MNRYSVNGNNQLVITKPGSGPETFDGSFLIGRDNTLIYKFAERKAPIEFRGEYRLNDDHDLELVLDKDVLTIKGNIISADAGKISFEVASKDKAGQSHIQVLKLGVIWLTDGTSRLSFIVKKRSPDIITLESAWELDDNQHIVYTYEKTGLKTKTNVRQSFLLQGYWLIGPDKLTYILRAGGESKFDFKAQVESPSIYPQKGLIKYRIGAGVRKTRSDSKIICLYGTWKLSRDLALSFQMDYGAGKLIEQRFLTDISLSDKDDLEFALKDKQGQGLGVSLIYSRKFLKSSDAELFLRLSAMKKEYSADTGVTIKF